MVYRAAMSDNESVVFALVGEGRGKSSAAFGYVNRAWGRNISPVVVQFLKGEQWDKEQIAVARRLGIPWHTFAPGLTWASDTSQDFTAKGAAAWATSRELLSAPGHGLVVLDEVDYAFDRQWLTPADLVTAIRERPRGMNVILTARVLPDSVLAVANVVTTMERVRFVLCGLLA